jgi:hypothetical protein
MKREKAYALVNKAGNIAIISGKLPIYWTKRVAQIDAEKFKLNVVQVFVSPNN